MNRTMVIAFGILAVLTCVGAYFVIHNGMTEDECVNASVFDVDVDTIVDQCGSQATNDQGGAQHSNFVHFQKIVKQGNATVYLGEARAFSKGRCQSEVLAVSPQATVLDLWTGEHTATIVCEVNGLVK